MAPPVEGPQFEAIIRKTEINDVLAYQQVLTGGTPCIVA